MNKMVRIALAVIFAGLIASTASAQVKQGNKVLQGLASYTSVSTDGGSSSTLNADISFGYLVTNAVEVGGLLEMTSTSAGGGTSTDQAIGGFGKYHFSPNSQAVPYVGGMFVSMSNSAGGQSTSSTGFGPLGGVKYFFKPNVALVGEGRYLMVSGQGGGSATAMQAMGGIALVF